MSFNVVHRCSARFGDETYALVVYFDKSAAFAIVADNVVQSDRSIDPNEDGSDVAIAGESRAWFDQELRIGRAAS